MLGTNPRPLAYSRPSGSFLVTSATPGTLAWYTLNPISPAALITRSGLASMNLAPRGFCWSSKPRTISGVVEAVAGAADDLVTDCFAAAALTVVFADLLFRLVICVLLKSRRAPVRGPCGKFEG